GISLQRPNGASTILSGASAILSADVTKLTFDGVRFEPKALTLFVQSPESIKQLETIVRSQTPMQLVIGATTIPLQRGLIGGPFELGATSLPAAGGLRDNSPFSSSGMPGYVQVDLSRPNQLKFEGPCVTQG